MAVSPGMLRLLRIRELEEEQSRAALELALAELHRLERALKSASEHDRAGRELVAESAQTGHVWQRFTGLEESRAAERDSRLLANRIESAAGEAAALRERLLNKRVARRQAETLVEEARVQQAVESSRREQQSLDDWFLNRRPSGPTNGDAAAPAVKDASKADE